MKINQHKSDICNIIPGMPIYNSSGKTVRKTKLINGHFSFADYKLEDYKLHQFNPDDYTAEGFSKLVDKDVL